MTDLTLWASREVADLLIPLLEAAYFEVNWIEQPGSQNPTASTKGHYVEGFKDIVKRFSPLTGPPVDPRVKETDEVTLPRPATIALNGCEDGLVVRGILNEKLAPGAVRGLYLDPGDCLRIHLSADGRRLEITFMEDYREFER